MTVAEPEPRSPSLVDVEHRDHIASVRQHQPDVRRVAVRSIVGEQAGRRCGSRLGSSADLDVTMRTESLDRDPLESVVLDNHQATGADLVALLNPQLKQLDPKVIQLIGQHVEPVARQSCIRFAWGSA